MVEIAGIPDGQGQEKKACLNPQVIQGCWEFDGVEECEKLQGKEDDTGDGKAFIIRHQSFKRQGLAEDTQE